MRNKKVKALRKKLGLKLPIKPDYRVSKTVKKIVIIDGVAVKAERQTIVNAAKFQYRNIKKTKGMA